MSIFPTKILLATDGSKDAELAARTAIGLASGTGSELHVVHVELAMPAGLPPYIPEESEPTRLKREARELPDDQMNKITAAGVEDAQAHLRMGGAAEEIVILGEEIGAGLIVVGSRGRSQLRRALMGSVSDSVVCHAHCPVLVVRGNARNRREGEDLPGRILLAVDGSREATVAREAAVRISNAGDTELHVVFVLPTEPYIPHLGPGIQEDWEGTFERAEQHART